MCLLGLVVGILFFVWSCLSPTDFGGRIKDFNFKKKKKVTITATEVDTEMLAERHIGSCFLHSGKLLESSTNVNSHNVLNSQVWEKLQVFGPCRNFALYLSVTRLSRAAFIFLSRHTHSFQMQSILRSHYTASKPGFWEDTSVPSFPGNKIYIHAVLKVKLHSLLL